jgi:hypothetical protein
MITLKETNFNKSNNYAREVFSGTVKEISWLSNPVLLTEERIVFLTVKRISLNTINT